LITITHNDHFFLTVISSLLTNFIKLSKYTLFSIICQTIYTILTNIQEKVRHAHTLIEIELCQFLTTITYNHHFIPTIISSLLTYFSSLPIQVAYSSKALSTVLLFLVKRQESSSSVLYPSKLHESYGLSCIHNTKYIFSENCPQKTRISSSN